MDEHRSDEAGAEADGPGLGHPPEPDEVSDPRAATPGPGLRALGLVAAGGAVGALARVALSAAFPVQAPGVPWTTLAENVGGALLLGLVLTLLLERAPLSDELRLLVCTGTLGAFTTYSTFATELAERLLGGHVLVALAYAAMSLVGGLAAAIVGIRLARAVTTGRSGGSTR